MKRHLITSALPYASGITHLGNVVGSTLPADIYARYCRLSGRPTLYVCGSDEHGVAITIAAEKEGVTPQQLVDRYHEANKKALAAAAIDFDIFNRTTDPLHAQTAQEFFRIWLDKGLLTEKEEGQFFDEQMNIFLPDRYVEGVCPNCGYDKARGDQCDNCGAYYNQLDLKAPRSIVSGNTPVVRNTKHWYFRLDAFQSWVEEYIESHAQEWKDNVLQQSRSWLKQGLAQRAATRDMAWGIPVPVKGAEGKVLYVWFEAVLGYISATKRWAQDNGKPDDWKLWWQGNDVEYTAFLGKDNIVFHSIIFPILLHTREDEDFVLPAQIPANEFLNLEGKKFSKSRNWAIDLAQFLGDFPLPEHVDALRYVLTMNMPETKDSDFTWKDFQARTNNELASILGNYVNRVMQFVHRQFNGVVPPANPAFLEGPNELALASSLQQATNAVASNLDNFRFRDAVTEAMNAARAANKYFNDAAPWKTIKDAPVQASTTMNVCLQTMHTLSIVFAPFLPHTSLAIQKMIGTDLHNGSVDQGVSDVWSTACNHVLPVGRALGQPQILINRMEDETVQRQLDALHAATVADADQPSTEGIDIETFSRVQLRTARIISAEPVPKSKKLLRLQVDLGTEQRQILAGIALHYTAEELVNKLVVVVANLHPAKLMGLESQGMVLAASNADGKLTLVTPSDPAVGAGAEVR